MEEATLRFENTYIDVRASQLGVDGVDIVGEGGVIFRRKRAEQRIVQARQLGHVSVARVARPVGETMVVRVQPRERGVHGMTFEVLGEEAVEHRGRIVTQDADPATGGCSSGMFTQRRSRNERSTALMSSCTCAPSSKLPSLPSTSPRISEMNEPMRLA